MIFSYTSLTSDEQRKHCRESIEEIFFLTTSKKEFASQEEKAQFLYKYLGIYFNKYPELILVAAIDGQILGYILGMPNTLDQDYFGLHPYLVHFEEQIREFPAHLHINLHPSAQGKGLGSLLLEEYIALLKAKNIKGLHITTGSFERNVEFYKKNAFKPLKTMEFKGNSILLMSRKIH